MKKRSFYNLLLAYAFSIASILPASFPSAIETYKILNEQAPFALSMGFAMSQTQESDNTASPEQTLKNLYQQAIKSTDPRAYLAHKDHIGYTLRSLPPFTCCQCKKKIIPRNLNLKTDKKLISKLLDDIAINIPTGTLTIKTCPECLGELIKQPRTPILLTPAHQRALAKQFEFLNVDKQAACKKHGLPASRISIELSDILYPDSTTISPKKLQEQVDFIHSLHNPLVFCHHYSNPAANPDLFGKKNPEATKHDIEWFADCCGKISAALPDMTYACPISQPVAFSHRVSRGTLPPFACDISQKEFLANLTKAQVAASRAMKAQNPNLKVLISHQWKPFKPAHGYLDPRYALERLICSIASRMYNGDFINMLQPHQNDFDGIALSVYPALHFNLWLPQGDNSVGTFNADDALEAILETHKAFPKKDIFIVETGCNTADPAMKKSFIDMTLHVCKIARDQGVPIKGVYFWSVTNDPDFYSEWNMLPGATNFSPFDRLDPADPCGSVNAAGLYLKEILSTSFHSLCSCCS